MATTTKGMGDDSDDSDSEYTPLFDDGEDNQRATKETKGWNLFREKPLKKESGSTASHAFIDSSVKVLKLLAYIIVFTLVLGSAVIAKGTLLFITSHLKKDREIPHCNRALGLDQQFKAVLPLEERLTWFWAMLIVFAFPEVGTFLRSVRICFFKTAKKPSKLNFFLAFLIETLHTIGIAMLVLMILPELDVVKGAMLMNGMCLVPAILTAFSRDRTQGKYVLKMVLDVLAISGQVTAFVVWPLLDSKPVLWTIPVASILVSLGFWENFISNVDKHSSDALIFLEILKRELKASRYYIHRVLSLWKIAVFMASILVCLHFQEEDPFSFFTSVNDAFGERNYTAYEFQVIMKDVYDSVFDPAKTGATFELQVSWGSALWVALIQVCSAYLCFGSAKFACKILIQNFSFTFALNLVGPLTVNLLIVFSSIYAADPCAFRGTIPDYLFFDIPQVYFLKQYLGREMAWVWILWMVSQAWVTMHTWSPRCERLASTDKLFTKPWYSGTLTDVGILMNRTKDLEDIEIPLQDLDLDDTSVSSAEKKKIKPSDTITRVYICATMWHENKEEMIEFLKSIFRLDEDQSARRVAQKYLGIAIPDYYELEANIFMDDAFEVSDHSLDDYQVNRFVKCLVDTVNEAASEVHLVNVHLRPPKKYPTPYGGKLVWTMPGKNKLICHLKDKAKIRHRKRWSQVMYMYYFLGHRLMDLPISVDSKEAIAENTYLLALDGDIDFKPSALTLLIDLMKKDKNLGAACGRIHPVGTGFMAWYQMFEYAIGHWLQKATEHMIGCVLCSPGCFSLFRGKALMDDNVMRKYTLTSSEPRHYVQYDQGEDRWLCTLLLQRGYRVEYSAASDSYTHCPEEFGEFFNQRRRWVPSTMANIFDLLADSKRTVKVNDNISTLYIMYQLMLMVGSVLGPGTIFLMMVGAMNAITGMSNMNALLINLIPLTIFIVVCMTCKSETQLTLANVITCLYAMLMMMVIVGIALQIVEDGWLAPSSIFFVLTFAVFFITAALHPQEIICLAYLGVYYITIPSMYMLLIIYSLCNLNNVSWGTREVAQKQTLKQMEAEKKEAENAKKKMDNQSLKRWFGKSEETTGSVEFSIAGLFRIICCVNPNDHKEDLHLLKIANAMEKMDKRLDSLGASDDTTEEAATGIPRRQTVGSLRRDTMTRVNDYEGSEASADIPKEDRDDLVNPYWIEDPNLQKGEVDFLTTAETEFWKDLIDEYLRPIDENVQEQERMAKELKKLRNTMVFAFLMVNSLFVLTIFLLQLNQDLLHLRWPFGQKVEIEYADDMNLITIDREYLMLEPIGFVFIVFFGSVMLVQFLGMLFHRMGTLTHLLATVELNWYCTRRPNEMSENALIEKHAVEIARDLQKLNDDDLQADGPDVTRRNTVANLENSRKIRQSTINLDANFKRRLTILQSADKAVLNRLPSLMGGPEERRNTLMALQALKDTQTVKRRSQLPVPRETNEFLYNASLVDVPGKSGRAYTRRGSNAEYAGRSSYIGRPSTSYVNASYEPADDSEDEPMPLPRKSSVWFKDTFA